MNTWRAAVIGCGGRGRAHATGYQACPETTLIACADPFSENLMRLADEFGVAHTYPDYREMLEKEKPDIVSVCTWTGLHLEMVLAAVEAGAKAIHCEKPIAPNWGDARKLVEACERRNVVLTFCHQRRFAAQFIAAKQLIQDGAIGRVHRLEGYCDNLIDWGTHWFDMFFYYNGETPAQWVMGQIDAEVERSVFGVPLETRGLSYIHYANDVVGLLVTGKMGATTCSNRILGDEGLIEVEVRGGPRLRYHRFDGQGWEVPELKGVAPHADATVATIFDLVDALKTGREPELSGKRALAATELIFGTYESARRRARVVLPLDIDDSPFIALLESGQIGPRAQAEPRAAGA